MNKRKSILYLLLIILFVILLYNFFIAPMLIQNQFGMGMHRGMYSYYYVDMRYVLIIILVIAGLFLYEIVKPRESSSKCARCGKTIENESWKIFLVCGTPIDRRKS